MNGTRILSRLSTNLRGSKCNSSPFSNFFKTSQSPLSSKRISCLSRVPVESSCLLSMMPLHSAIASARLQSVLSVDTQTWCLVPQGISMPL